MQRMKLSLHTNERGSYFVSQGIERARTLCLPEYSCPTIIWQSLRKDWKSVESLSSGLKRSEMLCRSASVIACWPSHTTHLADLQRLEAMPSRHCASTIPNGIAQ